MGSGKVAGAEKKLSDDLTAGEPECRFEELHPFLFFEWVMAVEPGAEGTILVANGLQTARVLDGGSDFQAVPDNRSVGEKPGDIRLAERGYDINIESAVRFLETGAFA